MKLLSRVISGGVPIRCVFPECTSSWSFKMTEDPDKISMVQRERGWTYTQVVPPGGGLVQGWACNDSAHHITEENFRA